MFAAQYDEDDDEDDGYVRAKSPAIRHEPNVDAKPIASALRRTGSKADFNAPDSASEPSTSRGNSQRGGTSAADLVQGARQTSFGSLPVYKPGTGVERKPRLDRIDSTTSDNELRGELRDEGKEGKERKSSSPRKAPSSEDDSRRGSRDGGRGSSGRSSRVGRGTSSRSAMSMSSDDGADDAYQYKSRRGEVFKRLLDVIGTAQCSPAARSRLWDAVKVLSRVVEDVKTLDADAGDDEVRHHLDRQR